jgi:predicted HTH transcriptional regulator
MSNIVDFLERMGQDARLRHASQNELELILKGEQIDPEVGAAIFAKDQSRLDALLGQANVCCAQFPGKEDEDEDTEESPSRDDDESASLSLFRAVASVG